VPDYDPPTRYTGTPHRFLLPAETILWRLHSRKIAATAFTPFSPTSGGRFDAPLDDPYGKHDTGTDAAAMLADILLRSVPPHSTSFRTIRRAAVIGQRASAITTATELHLVNLLDGPALAAVAQSRWLVAVEWTEFPRVQRWAGWIRTQAPWAHGFIWPATRNEHEQLIIMFADRCDSSAFEPDPLFEVDLDDDYGAVWLNGVMVRYRARINPPRKR
jgi:hypothetical protein